MIRVLSKIGPAQKDHIENFALSEMFQLRELVLSKYLKWSGLNCVDGHEIDQFDTPDTIYILSCDPIDGAVRGCVRLVPSLVPTLSSEVFADLFDGGLPVGPQIYDVSRIVVDPRTQPRGGPNPVAAELFVGWIEAGTVLGLDMFTAVVSLDQMYKRVARGWPMIPLGLPRQSDGSDILGIKVPLAEDTLRVAQRAEALGRTVLTSADHEQLIAHHEGVLARYAPEHRPSNRAA